MRSRLFLFLPLVLSFACSSSAPSENESVAFPFYLLFAPETARDCKKSPTCDEWILFCPDRTGAVQQRGELNFFEWRRDGKHLQLSTGLTFSTPLSSPILFSEGDGYALTRPQRIENEHFTWCRMAYVVAIAERVAGTPAYDSWGAEIPRPKSTL